MLALVLGSSGGAQIYDPPASLSLLLSIRLLVNFTSFQKYLTLIYCVCVVGGAA